ncbi:hypothetical protein F4802DRAFT_594239 [Xylaria palmicola]|nr:hypothetical protein F4802DRAFT_594239 [Xylaria palmicola]
MSENDGSLPPPSEPLPRPVPPVGKDVWISVTDQEGGVDLESGVRFPRQISIINTRPATPLPKDCLCEAGCAVVLVEKLYVITSVPGCPVDAAIKCRTNERPRDDLVELKDGVKLGQVVPHSRDHEFKIIRVDENLQTCNCQNRDNTCVSQLHGHGEGNHTTTGADNMSFDPELWRHAVTVISAEEGFKENTGEVAALKVVTHLEYVGERVRTKPYDLASFCQGKKSEYTDLDTWEEKAAERGSDWN